MNRSFHWFALLAGVALLIVGVRNLYLTGDWVVLVLSMLIVAFSISSILKSRQKD